ncbi:MAG: CopG family ribbon-helix-helix protein [Burkholderiales bacterium]
MSYTFGMKTAVSIPDDLYLAAESLARSNGTSRSRLFSDALREYLARHSPDTVTQTMDRVCEKAGDQDYAFAAAAARRILKRSEW